MPAYSVAYAIHGFMLAVAPICALIVAHQRGGLARPYTASRAKERELLRTIEDGKSAVEVSKASASGCDDDVRR